MNKLSRTKRYQDLRDRLDEETTSAQAQTVKAMPSRVSRSESDSLSHANQPLHPHQEEPQTSNIEFQASPVMDELLGEVKQYNIDNGTRYEDDTQINILRQLDSRPVETRKNSHFVEMEENPEMGGNTVKLPRSVNQELDIPSFMHEDLSFGAQQPESKIVLNSTNILVDDSDSEQDQLQIFEKPQPKEEQVYDEKPQKAKKLKKAKKQREKVSKKEEYSDDMPSAKMRMATEDYEEAPRPRKSGRVINFILVLLIILLFATIGVALFMLKDLGVF